MSKKKPPSPEEVGVDYLVRNAVRILRATEAVERQNPELALNRCPFCGCKGSRLKLVGSFFPFRLSSYVRCTECAATGPVSWAGISVATGYWNKGLFGLGRS